MSLRSKLSKRTILNLSTLLVIVLFLNLPVVSALEISNVRAEQLTENSAVVKWTTDSAADSFVNYGLSPENLNKIGDARLLTSHQLSLTNLNSAQAYYYSVESNGLVSDNNGALYSFATPAPDTLAPEIIVELPAMVAGSQINIVGYTEAGSRVSLFVNDVLMRNTIAEASAETAAEETAGETTAAETAAVGSTTEESAPEEPAEESAAAEETAAESNTAVAGAASISPETAARPAGRFTFPSIILRSNVLNQIRIEAVDPAGNEGSFTGQVFADTAKPELTLETVPQVTAENKIKIKATVSENSSLEIFVNNNSVAQAIGTVIEEEINLQEGDNKIKVIARDNAGWETVKEISVLSDTQPPRVEFTLTKGKEYYEGRAETDIVGETEPGAKVYLYIYQPRVDDFRADFKRAVETVTADSAGNFKFEEISFPPPPFSNLENLMPREVPSGLEEVMIPQLATLAEEQTKTYYLFVIAEDRTGKSGYDRETVHVNTCYSGNYAFDIFPNPDFPPQPFRLDPQLIEEGRETIGAVFNISYRGQASGVVDPATGEVSEAYQLIGDPRFEKACTREMAESGDYKLGCQLLGRLSPHGNSDKTVYYVTGSLQRADEFLESDYSWEDFQKRQLKFPLKILVQYQEREADGSMSDTKTQAFCYDLGYFVDIPIESSDLVPDFLANEGLSALNWTINAIEDIKPILETAMLVAGVSCFFSYLVKFLAKLYRNFMSYFESWTTRLNEPSCPSPIDQQQMFLPETIEHWNELRSRPDANFPSSEEMLNLADRCPATAAAWDFEATLDKLYKFTCDRFFCREVPAAWTSRAEDNQINDVLLSQTQCAATSNGVYLRKIENCQERLRRNVVNTEILQDIGEVFDCFADSDGNLYYPPPGRDQQPYLDSNIWVLRPVGHILTIGDIPPDNLLAYQPDNSDTFMVAVDESCDRVCRRTDGYVAATSGITIGETNAGKSAGPSPSPSQSEAAAGTAENCPASAYPVSIIGDPWNYRCLSSTSAQGCKSDTGEKGDVFEIPDDQDELKARCAAGANVAGQAAAVAASGAAQTAQAAASAVGLSAPGSLQSSSPGPCYREEYEGSNIILRSRENQQVTEGRLSAGYTKDCFINTADESLYQCVCELENPESGRPATGPREALVEKDGLAEEWSYHQAKIYEESRGTRGTHYSEDRYYSGRDWTGAFGLNSGLDNFRSEVTDMTSTTVNPHEGFGAWQSLCLPVINGQLNLLQSVLIGMRNCLVEAKYSSFQDAGMCKTLFTQHVCGLIYQGISALVNDCSPLTVRDEGNEPVDPTEGGLTAGWDAFQAAIPQTIESSQQELRSDYGASAEHYFATGTEGMAQSMCLAAFGYDVPIFDLDFITDAAYSVPMESAVYFPIANRELTSFDPERGMATYSYRLGGTVLPGCKIRGYRVYLKCVGPEDRGQPGIECEEQNCDCLNIDPSVAQPYADQRTYSVPGASGFGSITKLQVFDFPIESPLRVSSSYRYDHVVVELTLEQNEDPEQCFDEGYRTPNGGLFYFPINHIESGSYFQCTVDPLSGRYNCPELRSIFGGGQTYLEPPYFRCYDARNDEYVDCNTPNTFLLNDEITVRPHLNLGQEAACLRITESSGLFTPKIVELPADFFGSYTPPLSLGRVTEDMVGGGRIATITQAGNDYRCGINVLDRPDQEDVTSASLEFGYSSPSAGQYQLELPSRVTVTENDGYDSSNNLLAKSGDTDLTIEEINGAELNYQGFRFSLDLEGLSSGEGECAYNVRRGRSGGEPAAGRTLRATVELLQPGPDGGCYTTETSLPSTSLGKVTHTQNILIQAVPVEVAIASEMHEQFMAGDYDSVIGMANPVIQRRDADLAEATAIYYYVASLVMLDGDAGQIRSLLGLFFERNFAGTPVAAYSSGVTSTGEYEKIKKYLCAVDSRVGGTYQQYCGAGGESSSAAGATVTLGEQQCRTAGYTVDIGERWLYKCEGNGKASSCTKADGVIRVQNFNIAGTGLQGVCP